MKHLRRMLAWLMCLFLLPASAGAQSRQMPLQAAHRVTMTQRNHTQKNGSLVYRWQIETAHAAVSEEINALAKAYEAEVAPTMAKPGKDSTSRLDVNILHSRTGLSWMSFMVQSRYTLGKVTKDVRFATRTYDMATGGRILLTDIFTGDSEAWPLLAEAVRNGVNAYYPALKADQAALEAACSREAIGQMDFTLHGMSLALHLHAADFYPGKQQLIEVRLYYPQLRPLMTEKARAETDNLAYYNTIALTFDDGPNGWITRDILNVMMQRGVRATFFLVGDRMRGYAQYVQREHDEGHAIATHNYKHEYANKLTQERLHSLARQVKEVHEEIIGIAPAYCRAPGGIWNPMANAGLGWPLIQWSSQGTDWQGENGRDPKKVLAQVISRAEDGAIILMHDLKKNSITSTELIIDRLQADGFIFLTVDELFAKDGVVLQPDTPYWRCSDGLTNDPGED